MPTEFPDNSDLNRLPVPDAIPLYYAPHAILTMDSVFRIVQINDVTEQVFGYLRDELIGRDVDIVLPESVRNLRSRLRDANPDGTLLHASPEGYPLHGRRKDESEFPVEIRVRTIDAEHGPLIIAAVHDITHRTLVDKETRGSSPNLADLVARQTEDLAQALIEVRQRMSDLEKTESALRLSESRLAGIVSLSEDGIIALDESQRITLYNEGAEKIFGWTAAEVAGNHLEMLLPERFRARHGHQVQQFARSPETLRPAGVRGPVVALRKDGSEFPAEASISKFELGGEVTFAVRLRDISERLKVEEALRKSEEGFRKSFELAAIGKAIVAIDGNFLDANTTLCALTGHIKEDLLKGTLENITHPEDRAENVSLFNRMRSEEISSYEIETRLVHRTGRPLWTLMNVAAITDQSGTLLFFIAEIQDIRVRKQAEQDLLDSELRYRRLFENNPQPMWVYDLDTLGFLAVNDAAVESYGYSREEFLGMSVADLEPAENVAPYPVVLSDVEGGDRRMGPWQHRRKDGAIIAVELSTHDLYFAGRNGRMVLVDDITERLKAERALLESERTLRALVGSLDEIVFEFDGNGTYLNIWTNNDSTLFGTRENAIGRRVADVVGVEIGRPLTEAFRRVLETNQPETIEYALTIPEGTRWIEGSITPIQREDGSPRTVSMLTRDITEQKTLEEQLRQAQKMEAVGRLAAGIAHDFNNLLTVIIGGSELIKSDPGNRALLEEITEQIGEAGKRAASLTQQLLAFGRKQILEPRILDLNDIVANIEKLLRRVIGENIDFRAFAGPDLGQIKADPTQLDQVLINLAVNARDAMPEGGKLTIATRNIDADEAYAREHPDVRPGSYVVLEVTDTGHGMDTETRERAFEPFFTTKGQGNGSGLGLSTVYGIVKQSGGHIEMHSSPGFGTLFQIYFPRVHDFVARPAGNAEIRLMPAGSETILLVEDEEPLRNLVQRILRSRGYTVLTAGDGLDAIRLAEGHPHPIHLLLTDVVLPQLGGPATAERLKALLPDLKVLFMSGYTDAAVIHEGVKEARTAFLAKPFSPDTLAGKVRDVLDGVA